MKWEYQLYSGLSLLIVFLLIVQSYLIRIDEKPFSEVNRLESFNQLLVAIECNIFLMEGEKQNMLVEGPGGKMKNIETIYNEGCITIKKNKEKLLSRILRIINGDKYIINIYITVNNLDDFYIDAGNDQPEVKYSAEDMIGLTLKDGNILILESKKIKSCYYLTS